MKAGKRKEKKYVPVMFVVNTVVVVVFVVFVVSIDVVVVVDVVLIVIVVESLLFYSFRFIQLDRPLARSR